MIQVVYTHSNCEDLWDAFQKQNSKHCNIPLHIISNSLPPNADSYDGGYIYTNDMPYYHAWINGLDKFNPDYFIYLQEDFILYDNVDEVKVNEYLTYLKAHPEYSFIRLLKSGSLGSKKVTETLYEIEPTNPDIFSMQATIWRTQDYVQLLNYVKEERWFENNKYREAAIKLNIKGLYHYDNENKRGGNHFDSTVYPYVATALVRGKWNLLEYEKELGPILSEYNIDYTKRGKFQ